jgi:hypothetical protein
LIFLVLFPSREKVRSPAQRFLNGGYDGQIGVAKSFKVYPGDKVKIEAQGKYVTGSGGTNITGFAAALTGVFGVSSSSTVMHYFIWCGELHSVTH